MSKVICFDLRPLQIGHENRGIGMVIKSILENLDDKENKYIFYIFYNNNPVDRLGFVPKIKYQLVETPKLTAAIKKSTDILPSIRLIFHKFHRLKKFKPDIFVQFDLMLGLPKWRGVKTVIIAYDLIPLIMRNDYLPSPYYAWSHKIGKKAKIKAVVRAIYYNTKYKLYYSNYKKSDKVISISESTRRSFIDILKIKPEKIKTIPLAPVFIMSKKGSEVDNQINKPYIFYIGGTDRRKQIDHVINAFNIVRGRGYDLRLVLAGNELKNRNTIPDDITRGAVNASPYKNDIKLLGFVNDSQKQSLYANAHAFVFCSSYEGFGLPVIEAAVNSCPVVAYNNSSIPEVYGDQKTLVKNGDYVAAANRIIELFDNEERLRAIKQGVSKTKELTWTKTTDFFMSLILKG